MGAWSDPDIGLIAEHDTAIGTDGAASNDSQNMFEAMTTTALLQKLAALDDRRSSQLVSH